jgi:hypothetical protein
MTLRHIIPNTDDWYDAMLEEEEATKDHARRADGAGARTRDAAQPSAASHIRRQR